jgi:hypothetical protein
MRALISCLCSTSVGSIYVLLLFLKLSAGEPLPIFLYYIKGQIFTSYKACKAQKGKESTAKGNSRTIILILLS